MLGSRYPRARILFCRQSISGIGRRDAGVVGSAQLADLGESGAVSQQVVGSNPAPPKKVLPKREEGVGMREKKVGRGRGIHVQSVDISLGKTVKPQPKWPKVPFVDTCIMALIL